MRNPGFMYLIGSQVGLFKIGASNNPELRVRGLGCSHPWKLWLVWKIGLSHEYKARSLEENLHYHFRRVRAYCEWFSLSTKDVELIKSISAVEVDRGEYPSWMEPHNYRLNEKVFFWPPSVVRPQGKRPRRKHRSSPVRCLDCEWVGRVRDAVQIDDLDHCPCCAAVLECATDEPVIVTSEDPNAVTK